MSREAEREFAREWGLDDEQLTDDQRARLEVLADKAELVMAYLERRNARRQADTDRPANLRRVEFLVGQIEERVRLASRPR